MIQASPVNTPAARSKNAVYVFASFVALYCWYTAFFYNFSLSPLGAIATMRGADPGLLSTIFNLCCAVSILTGFFVLRDIDLAKHRKLWIGLHAGGLISAFLLPIAPNPMVFYVLTALSGLFLGAIAYRVFYSMFFFIINPSPVKAVAIAYIFIQGVIHLYTIAPINDMPWLFFAIGGVTLCAGLFFSLKFDGNVVEARWLLPENRISLRETWPMLAYVLLVQICFSLYKAVLIPRMEQSFWTDVYQILPNAVTLIAFLLFSRFFTIGRTLRIFLVLITGGFFAFMLAGSGGRNIVETFMQPAYLFWDLYFFWMMYSIFFTYGRKFMRLRVFLCVNIVSLFLAEVVASLVIPLFPADPRYIALIFPFVFGLYFFIPPIERFARNMSARRQYAERQDVREVLPPHDRPDIARIGEDMARSLPQGTAFTETERQVLAYIIDDHDSDVTAYFLSLPLREVRAAEKSLCEKCGAASRSALLIMIGSLKRKDQINDLAAILADYDLSPREEEVCTLLLSGRTLQQISNELGIAFSTTNTYCKSLYRKLNVNSRTELYVMLGVQPVETTKAPGL